jgi:hypothetical protein
MPRHGLLVAPIYIGHYGELDPVNNSVRSILGSTAIFVVALLLACSTPIGAGEGVHRDQLLHLALPHTHPGQQSVPASEQARADAPTTVAGAKAPVEASASTAVADELGIGLSVAVRDVTLAPLPQLFLLPALGHEALPPRERLEAPWPGPPRRTA